MSDLDNTRDVAVTAAADIRSHVLACERRYQENIGAIQRLTDLVQDSHRVTTIQIDEIKAVLAEQRGAGRVVKAIGALGAAVAGAVGGIGATHIIK